MISSDYVISLKSFHPILLYLSVFFYYFFTNYLFYQSIFLRSLPNKQSNKHYIDTFLLHGRLWWLCWRSSFWVIVLKLLALTREGRRERELVCFKECLVRCHVTVILLPFDFYAVINYDGLLISSACFFFIFIRLFPARSL